MKLNEGITNTARGFAQIREIFKDRSVHSSESGLLLCGDCLELMRELPDGCVDAVVTDPPYGIGFRNNQWDSQIPLWLDEAKRISTCVIFTTAPLTQWDYPKPDWVGCFYRDAACSRSLLGGFNHWTPIMVYGKPDVKVDSIKLHAIANAQPHNYPHPSPKPINLMLFLVGWTPSNAIILDPFLGSGTTAVAALRTGRQFIGMEISPEYCAIAQKRVDYELSQTRLAL